MGVFLPSFRHKIYTIVSKTLNYLWKSERCSRIASARLNVTTTVERVDSKNFSLLAVSDASFHKSTTARGPFSSSSGKIREEDSQPSSLGSSEAAILERRKHSVSIRVNVPGASSHIEQSRRNRGTWGSQGSSRHLRYAVNDLKDAWCQQTRD